MHTTSKLPRHGVTFWCTAALVVLAVYIGAYYVCVAPTHLPHRWRYGSSYEAPQGWIAFDPIYSRNPNTDRTMATFFSPMHFADRRLRPHAWAGDFDCVEATLSATPR